MTLNTRKDGDYGYIAFYKGKKVEVYAPSSYAAQKLASVHFGVKRSYEITVVLCERSDGSQVVHTPDF